MGTRPAHALRLTLGCGESLLGLPALQWVRRPKGPGHPPGKQDAPPPRAGSR